MFKVVKITWKYFIITFLLVTVLLFNLAVMFRGHFLQVGEPCTLGLCQNFRTVSQGFNDKYIHVAFFGKYAFKNMKIVRGMAGTFHSILKNTDSPIFLHVMIDKFSKQRAARTLRKVARTFKRRMNVTYYDVNDMADQNRQAVSTIRRHFFNKDVGRYNDDIFFLSEVFHEALPRRLRRLIFLDVDLKFLADIRDLHREFDRFLPQNVIGIAPDLQPQYRVDFSRFRHRHPDSPVGSPGGRQGFNTGVVLFDLDRMRRSTLYNSLLNSTLLEGLCKKYEFEGYLGHQDFYTLTGMEYPELYYRLDCSWNRQLDVGWRNEIDGEVFDVYHQCQGKIKVLHANGDSHLPSEKEVSDKGESLVNV